MGPQLCELRITAGDESLAGVIGVVSELYEIALIEEPELQRLALEKRADLPALERRDWTCPASVDG